MNITNNLSYNFFETQHIIKCEFLINDFMFNVYIIIFLASFLRNFLIKNDDFKNFCDFVIFILSCGLLFLSI